MTESAPTPPPDDGGVHAVAFDGGLGQPLVATPGALCTSTATLAHRQSTVAPAAMARRMLPRRAGPGGRALLAQLPAAPGLSRPTAYVGGDYRLRRPRDQRVPGFDLRAGGRTKAPPP